jgi:hypothetical protein
MKLADAYRGGVKFRDTREGDEWVIYAKKGKVTGVGRAPYEPAGAGNKRHLEATQAAIDDLERKLS